MRQLRPPPLTPAGTVTTEALKRSSSAPPRARRRPYRRRLHRPSRRHLHRPSRRRPHRSSHRCLHYRRRCLHHRHRPHRRCLHYRQHRRRHRSCPSRRARPAVRGITACARDQNSQPPNACRRSHGVLHQSRCHHQRASRTPRSLEGTLTGPSSAARWPVRRHVITQLSVAALGAVRRSRAPAAEVQRRTPGLEGLARDQLELPRLL